MRSCDCFLSVFISLLFGFKGSLKPEPVKMLSFDCYLKQKLQKKKSSILGCRRRSVASWSRKVILPLCLAALRPHLKCCVQSWAPHYKTDMDLLK